MIWLVEVSGVSEQDIDMDVLYQLREILGDEVDVLMAEFFDTAPQSIGKFAAALEAGNLVEAGSIVHSLKSSSGNLGFIKLSMLCRAAEEQSRTGVLVAAETWPHRLQQSLEDAMAALEGL